MNTQLGRVLTPRQIGELDAREFLGDDTWVRWKQDLDALLAYRKTVVGKPTDEQRLQLAYNNASIDYYNAVLFHSARLAAQGRCACARCGRARS